MNTGTVLLLSQDLLFSSRIASAARDAGVQLQQALSVQQLIDLSRGDDVTGVLIDLEFTPLDVSGLLQELRRDGSLRVIAYGPHVHHQRLAAAASAGCDEVLSRGQLDSSLADVLQRLQVCT